MRIEFEKSINDSFLVIYPEENKYKENYEIRMICDNIIPNLIKTEEKIINGQVCFFYNVSKLKAMTVEFGKKEMELNDVKSLILSLINVGKRLDEYLLSEDNLILDPGYIYLQESNYYFMYFPYNEGKIGKSLSLLSEYLISKVNHKDNKAVKLAYGFYNMVYSGNYAFDNLLEEIENEVDFETDMGESRENEINKDKDIEAEIHNEIITNDRKRVKNFKVLFSIIIIAVVLCIITILGKI